MSNRSNKTKKLLPFRMIVPEGKPVNLHTGGYTDSDNYYRIASITSVKTIKSMGTEVIGMCREVVKRENTSPQSSKTE